MQFKTFFQKYIVNALQLKKGVRKGELTFVATVKLKSLDMVTTQESGVVVNVLKELANVIPLKLSKTLPPHRGVDHRIKLEPRVKPKARPPYYKAPPKLAKLK